MSTYYNQNHPPVGAPPPQGYPKVEGYPPPGYPVQGYAPQGYPPQGYPPQQGYGQPAQPHYEEQRRWQDTGFLEGCFAAIRCCCLLDEDS
ncbi:cysteine-rich and transmembrane domain-containing protein WIH1 isoform X3 [Eucalyptus grandis]|nr:cysteine-rich and transmembrane domain-containing protein WIH1 isoform X3 [Eucalyptus grandis]